jgi:hypothetical protein
MNTQHEAIGLGLFFKRRPYDYTNDEFNLPQGHEDLIRRSICFPRTGNITRKTTTVLFFQVIGWNAQEFW